MARCGCLESGRGCGGFPTAFGDRFGGEAQEEEVGGVIDDDRQREEDH